MDIEITVARVRTPELVEELVRVWERSVRATHDFLTEEDVAGILPHVPGALLADERLAVAWEGGRPVAFAGAQGGKLEKLFCAPEARGRGVGRALLAYAVERWDVHRLDCNEQNPQARGFYEHEGFAVASRSATDGGGRPFPLLHMERTDGIRAQMGSGEWFDAAAPELEVDRNRARAIMRRFNVEADLSEEERRELLGGLLGSFGEDAVLSVGAQVDYGYRIFVGAGCFFNFNCTFLDGAAITFGRDVWVGPSCTFCTPLHPLLGRERAMRKDDEGARHLWERNLPITVGDDVWIAANVTVNPGVTIGDGAVIGSGSVVTKDIPPRTLAYGNPCRPVRSITEADSVAAELIEAGMA